MTGYPGDAPLLFTMYKATGPISIVDVDNNQLKFDMHLSGGQSGGPTFITSSNIAIGINSAVGNTMKQATRINDEMVRVFDSYDW